MPPPAYGPLFSSGRRKILLFLKKKKQKDFWFFGVLG
jgi:hypothetical protein